MKRAAQHAQQIALADHAVRFRGSHPGIGLYALLEGAIDDTLLGRLCASYPGLAWASLHAGRPEGIHAECTPLLFAIAPDTKGTALLERLLSLEEEIADHVLLLWSPHTLQAIRNHLAPYGEIRLDGEQRALLRFHDPEIWSAALSVMEENEKQHFLSPFTAIWLPDADGRWCGEKCGDGSIPSSLGEIHWNAGRLQRFNQAIQPWHCLRRLEKEFPIHLTGNRTDWLTTLTRWLGQTAQHGVKTPGETYLYCVTALLAGQDFAREPGIAAELAAIGDRHPDFASALQAVPAATWERLEKQPANG